MPQCPECGVELTELGVESKAYQAMELVHGESPRFTEMEWGEQVEYFCPKCNTTLAESEQEAIDVLKGVREPALRG